mgnify:CR=1 FL=1
MRKIERIYIHCSASDWGEVKEIGRWHLERGFLTIGYHFVITNPFPCYWNLKDDMPNETYDGKIWKGRNIETMGAHVKNDNANSIGICLVGTGFFTKLQLESARDLCILLAESFGIPLGTGILGHYEYWLNLKPPQIPQKSCPNLRMNEFRGMLKSVEVTEDFKNLFEKL